MTDHKMQKLLDDLTLANSEVINQDAIIEDLREEISKLEQALARKDQ